MRIRLISAALVAVLALAWPSSPAAADSQCGPFGDSPAEVQHGWFASFVSEHQPVCFGARLLGPWNDSSGSARYACLYEPKSARADNPLPLVIFLHGSIASADSVRLTGLTHLIESGDLGGAVAGFILLAPEGRYTTHRYPRIDSKGLGWDNWYRQLNPAGEAAISKVTYAENADAAAIDHFVEEEISTGKVDRKHIYVMGWSNGAAMGILYALNRPQVAAAAVYSAPNPFAAFDDPCGQKPVAHPATSDAEVQVVNPRVAIMHVRNSCDIGGICPNGIAISQQLRAIGTDFQDVIVGASGEQVAACDDSCGTNPMAGKPIGFWGGLRGAKNHLFWPKRWTDRMLEFLKRHPLSENH
jgi:predicted esterase